MTSVLLRNATATIAGATLASVVLAAVAADAGHAGQATGADRAASLSENGAASPAAAEGLGKSDTAAEGLGKSDTAADSPEAAQTDPNSLGSSAPADLGPVPTHLVVPELFASLRGGFTAAQVEQIGALAGVRAVMPVDGAQVSIDGVAGNVLGVSPRAFRAWAPPAAADTPGIWAALANGDLIASQAPGSGLGLTPGARAQLTGGSAVPMTVAATVQLGLPGVDGVVDMQRADQLGLVANVAVLINAPGANLAALMQQVQAVTGPTGRVVNLVPIVTTTTTELPVITVVPSGMPTSYLTLYQASAAKYCPGLSWTVLAAIGQIESDHGTNDGPSSAGALGPMQFLPSTWAAWGIDGFGQTGPPDVMKPLDAVPSAARLLCADGAAAGGASLEAAIYDYNHADWYVSEVLQLAHEYAQEYP